MLVESSMIKKLVVPAGLLLVFAASIPSSALAASEGAGGVGVSYIDTGATLEPDSVETCSDLSCHSVVYCFTGASSVNSSGDSF